MPEDMTKDLSTLVPGFKRSGASEMKMYKRKFCTCSIRTIYGLNQKQELQSLLKIIYLNQTKSVHRYFMF
jgi:hypothetical protein